MQVAFEKLLQSHFDTIDKASGLEARRVAHAFSPGFTKTLNLENLSVAFLWEDPTIWLRKATTASVIDVTLGAGEAVCLVGAPEIEVLVVGYGAYFLPVYGSASYER